MRRTRTIVFLLIGIALVVGLHLLVDLQTASVPRALRRNALLPGAEDAIAIEICRRGECATVLTHDGEWKITSPYAAPADRARVLRLVDALAFAPAHDEMTDAELLRIGRTRSDFGLDPARISVSVSRAGVGRMRASFGDATPTGDGVYATVDDGDMVFVVPTNVLAAADYDADGFRRRRFFERTADQVVAIDVKGATAHFLRLARDGEAWKVTEPYSSVASTSRVQAFLDAILALEACDFVRPTATPQPPSSSLLAGYGLDPESSVTVTLKCLDGKDLMVSLGRMLGNDRIYAQMPGGDIATVALPDPIRSIRTAGVTAFVDTRLFPFEAKAVTMLSMDDGGTKYLLSRGSDGDWRLDTPISAAADQAEVGKLLDRILSLRTADADSSGVCVSVGTNAEPVSVSRTALLKDQRLEDLRAREILRVDPAHLKRLVMTDSSGAQTAVVFDAENRTWIIENTSAATATSTCTAVDREAVDHLAAALNPLKAVRIERLRVSAAELGVYGLDKPLRTVAIDQTTENAVRRNIRIGEVTDGGRYATFASADAVFVISPESAAALLAPVVK